VSERQKSQKGFVAVTLITLLAIAAVLIVYASLLATFQGGEVVVGQVQGQVWYSPTNGTTENWNLTLKVNQLNNNWYAKVNFTGAYKGEVQITWQLERKDETLGWKNATAGIDATVVKKITTSFTLDGSAQTAYASDPSSQITNMNWGGTNMIKTGSYRVVVYIDSKA